MQNASSNPARTRSWLIIDPGSGLLTDLSKSADRIVLDFAQTSIKLHEIASTLEKLFTDTSPSSLAAFLPSWESGRMEAAARLVVQIGIPSVLLAGVDCGADVQRLEVLLRVEEANADASRTTEIIALLNEAGLTAPSSFQRCSSRLKALGLQSASTWQIRRSDVARQARGLVVLTAKAAGLGTIDQASDDIGVDEFRDECVNAHDNGFVGKLTRLPNQIPIINELFDT